jgi:hypothetical protein
LVLIVVEAWTAFFILPLAWCWNRPVLAATDDGQPIVSARPREGGAGAAGMPPVDPQ